MQFVFSCRRKRHVQYFSSWQGMFWDGEGFTSRRVIGEHRVRTEIVSQRVGGHLNAGFRSFKKSKFLFGIRQLRSGSCQLRLCLLELFSELPDHFVITVRVTAKSNGNGKHKGNQKS